MATTSTYKLGIGYGTDIGQKGHIIAAFETWHKKGIDSFKSLQDRSDFLNLRPRSRIRPVTGPNFLMRPFVSPTNFTAGGILLQPGSALDHVEFLPGGGGASRPLPFSGVGQLTGGCNCQARPTLEYGVNSDFEVDTPADRGVLFAHYDHDDERPQHFLRRNPARRHAAAKPLANCRASFAPWQGGSTPTILSCPRRLSRQMQTENRPFIGFGIFTPNNNGNPFDGGRLIAKNRYGQLTGGFSHTMSDNFLAGGWC